MTTRDVREFEFAGDEPTLPDLLSPGLRVVFIGINPSRYSVERGHYFARPANRFWSVLSGSRLSERARVGLSHDFLRPEDDRDLPAFGIGFTDIVKRPTASASELRAPDFAFGAPQLLTRLATNGPRIACFQGATALRPFLRYALGVRAATLNFGLQPNRIGEAAIFLTPNPSPANANYQLADLINWFDELAKIVEDS